MMKAFKKWITSPAATIILFAAAAGLLLFSTISGVRAALQYVSENYTGHVEMYDIGVSLREKCQTGDSRIVAYRNHIKNSEDQWNEVEGGVGKLLEEKYFLGDDPELVIGKTYPEEISVENTGNIDEYVRVTLYRYWTDPEGNKVFEPNTKGSSTQGLSPALIDLNLVNENVWLLDESASTEERLVFYYAKMLGKQDGSTSVETLQTKDADSVSLPLCDSITIDKSIADKVTQTETVVDKNEEGVTHTKITTKYDYDGWKFCLEAEVDAVQNHNIVDAAKSAWGVDLKLLDNGDIQLAK